MIDLAECFSRGGFLGTRVYGLRRKGRDRVEIARKNAGGKSGRQHVLLVSPVGSVVAVFVAATLLFTACGDDDDTVDVRKDESQETVVSVSSSAGDTGTTAASSSSSGSQEKCVNEAFGLVKEVRETGSGYELVIDYAEFLSGEEAIAAAQEDGEIPPEQDWLDNDYYVRNRNDRLRTFPIVDSVLLRPNFFLLIGGSPNFHPVSAVELAMEIRANALVWIDVKDGVVVRIEEQYIP